MEDEEDLYDCVYDDEDGGEIYEDLMKTEALPPPVSSITPCLFTLKPDGQVDAYCLFFVFCKCRPSSNRPKSTSGAAV